MSDPTLSNMTLESINELMQGSLIGHLGIEILDIGDRFVKGRMPVDERTRQPQGALHGGASAAFAETLGGVGSAYYLNLEKQFPIGVEVNANHMRAATSDYVYGAATALHLGKRTHVWEIKIVDEEGKLICASRLTNTIIDL
uniref:1,4-dihydroxy-2-naphthoyl-CoA hydrolase n=2 Tax=unclassified Candidatus Kentrum TaxID=2643149 RepID=A0A451A3N8_9GAMM|nr:MAG: 1,4-dihydroxy-2-naphthoyl-CoA hydrolase [Candidatus Kentron sp. LPFa]VFK14751.1 MAG: 1,4-dihydroxy-2-naphthoyl-CoA hydrolase [Candidatus Kentron sp. LPFa]VFK30526.1 MAG: 1,4-dihydroxy-2-naphthoyl-CoA hydrolase [Candidatus Kentron sp. LPFa]VFK60650.1 MAG: 1,4-dihydroxy-2-naphthoyl-CoA hydrolase [Candidatus Kentron sp. UNK]VFK69847.1 MAG: 1,4-dihydroxy-2-naphthoyl-CoA hydrolase [Candidatus Kentron sp. UNK]